MSKYDYYAPYGEELPDPLVAGESLIWSGKPKRNAYVLNRSVTMMPIAIIWLFFDLNILSNIGGSMGNMGFFLVPFFLLHLMPVWIWLGNLLTAGKQWKNTKYYLTDRRIIIQSGVFNADIQSIYYKDIRNVNLRIGMIDKMLGVGDIHFDLGDYSAARRGRHAPSHAFLDIEEPRQVYPIIQKTVLDMQSDIEYPNAYRPAENPGYNTTYRP